MKYSNKDMTGWNLSNETDMDGLTIENSCLSNCNYKANILPANLTGVTFIGCNLDNVVIPPGNTLINCSNRFYKVGEDGEDWLVDPLTDELIEPLN